MCLAVPAKIISVLDADRAKASIGGIVKEISIALLDDVVPGDFVILHVGYALNKLDPQEAERTLEVMAADGTLEEVRHEIR